MPCPHVTEDLPFWKSRVGPLASTMASRKTFVKKIILPQPSDIMKISEYIKQEMNQTAKILMEWSFIVQRKEMSSYYNVFLPFPIKEGQWIYIRYVPVKIMWRAVRFYLYNLNAEAVYVNLQL